MQLAPHPDFWKSGEIKILGGRGQKGRSMLWAKLSVFPRTKRVDWVQESCLLSLVFSDSLFDFHEVFEFSDDSRYFPRSDTKWHRWHSRGGRVGSSSNSALPRSGFEATVSALCDRVLHPLGFDRGCFHLPHNFSPIFATIVMLLEWAFFLIKAKKHDLCI